MILDRRYKLGHMEKALRGHQPEFGKMATYRIDGLGPLAHQKIASAKHHRRSLLFLLLAATKRIVGRCAASQIASASAASFFCLFTKGLT